jgi:hypothetical protein
VPAALPYYPVQPLFPLFFDCFLHSGRQHYLSAHFYFPAAQYS